MSFEKFAAKVCLIAVNESWLPPAARSYDYNAAEHVDDKPICPCVMYLELSAP